MAGGGWLVAGAAAAAAGAAAVLAEAALEAGRPVIRHLRFAVEGRRLRYRGAGPPAADVSPALRMVHLTDLHLHRRAGRAHRKAVQWLEHLAPHLVVVTGDLVDRASRGPAAQAWVGRLARRWQLAVVWGNHDHEVPALRESLARALEAAGAWVLVNRRVCLTTRAGTVELVGVDAPNLGLDRMGEALAKPPLLHTRWDETARRWSPEPPAAARRPEGPPGEPWARVVAAHSYHVLEHEPPVPEESLVLTGDTHGGQIVLPLLGPVWARWVHRHRYVQGLHRVGRRWLYVSTGIGTIGVPLRLRCPPEVTVVDLMEE